MSRGKNRELTPRQQLRDRIELADWFYADAKPRPIRGAGSVFELVYSPEVKGTRRLVQLNARTLGATSFTLAGLANEIGAESATADMIYFGQEPKTEAGISLGTERSITVATAILEYFMFADSDQLRHEAAGNLNRYLIDVNVSGLSLPNLQVNK